MAGDLADHAAMLNVMLARWQARDDSRAEPGARRAADMAMTETGAMLRGLHELRARLAAEIRAHDRMHAARAGAMPAADGAAR